MIEFLNSLIDKLWLRPISLPFLYIFSVLGALGYAPDPPDPFTWKTYSFWTVFLVIDIIYTILVIKNNSLPRAKDSLSSVLFIIDAECDQFFNDIEKKLVSEFADCTADSNGKSYSALCVNQKRLRNFDFWNEEFMLKLLNKSNRSIIPRYKKSWFPAFTPPRTTTSFLLTRGADLQSQSPCFALRAQAIC